MNMLFNLKYALRLLAQSPFFTALCIFVMSLGLGLFIEIYSSIRSLAYTDLPVNEPDKWVFVVRSQGDVEYGGNSIDEYTYTYFKENSNKLTNFGLSVNDTASLYNGEKAQTFNSSAITPSLLQSVGVKPVLGRILYESDVTSGNSSTLMISYQLWQNYFAGDPEIIGKSVQLNNNPAEVVGVLPKNFGFPINSDIWMPFKAYASAAPFMGSWGMVVAQLKDGASIEEASFDIFSMYETLAQESPNPYRAVRGKVMPFTQQMMVGSMFYVYLLIAAGIVIALLACINIGSLLMARASERVKEAAIRSALGASRQNLIANSLLESFIICVISCIIGLIIASYSLTGFHTVFGTGPYVPFWWQDGIDSHTIWVAVIMTVLMWLFTGLFPAIKASGFDIAGILNDGSKGSGTAANNKLTSILLAVEITLSCALLTTAFVMVLAIDKAGETGIGVKQDGFITGTFITPNFSVFDDVSAEGVSAANLLYNNVMQDLIEHPGVENVTMATSLPGSKFQWRAYNLEDRDVSNNGRMPVQMVNAVHDNYFDVMDIKVLEGRAFNELDTYSGNGVVIVEDKFAEKIWPGESALGKVLITFPGEPWEERQTIVGVIPQILNMGAVGDGPNQTTIYVPLRQRIMPYVTLIAEVKGEPYNFIPALEDAMAHGDKTIPLSNISTLEESLGRSVAPIKYFSGRFIYFACVALILAAIGVYGVMARSISQQSADIAVRRAVGATDLSITWLYLRKGLVYLAIGLPVGLISAVLFLDVAQKVYVELLSYVPLVAVVIVLLISLVVLAASFIPTRRALKIEPSVALTSS